MLAGKGVAMTGASCFGEDGNFTSAQPTHNLVGGLNSLVFVLMRLTYARMICSRSGAGTRHRDN